MIHIDHTICNNTVVQDIAYWRMGELEMIREMYTRFVRGSATETTPPGARWRSSNLHGQEGEIRPSVAARVMQRMGWTGGSLGNGIRFPIMAERYGEDSREERPGLGYKRPEVRIFCTVFICSMCNVPYFYL